MSAFRFDASWAVWGAATQTEPFDDRSDLCLPVGPALDDVLHARDVLVGLNQSSVARDSAGRPVSPAGASVPWANFHTSAFHNDHFLAEAFRGTEVWGAYMTDLHEQRESDIRKVHEHNIDAEISSLISQMHLLGATGEAAPRIICFGVKSYRRITAWAGTISRGSPPPGR